MNSIVINGGRVINSTDDYVADMLMQDDILSPVARHVYLVLQ